MNKNHKLSTEAEKFTKRIGGGGEITGKDVIAGHGSCVKIKNKTVCSTCVPWRHRGCSCHTGGSANARLLPAQNVAGLLLSR